MKKIPDSFNVRDIVAIIWVIAFPATENGEVSNLKYLCTSCTMRYTLRTEKHDMHSIFNNLLAL